MEEFLTIWLPVICWLLVLIPEGYSKLYLRVCKSVFATYILSLGIYACIADGVDTFSFIVERFAFLAILSSLFLFVKALDEKSKKIKVFGYGTSCSLWILLFFMIH